MTRHLDHVRLRKLLDGELSVGEERILVEHLAHEDCPRCDEFLERLDERLERELLAILERVSSVRDLPRAARDQVLDGGRPGRMRAPAFLVPAAGCALLLVVGLTVTLWHVLDRGEETVQATKGVEAPIVEVDLTVGLVIPDGKGQARITRVADGAEVPDEGSAVFRVNTDRPCYLYLVRIDAGGAVDWLLPEEGGEPFRHAGGVFTPKSGSRPAGVKLEGLGGAQVFAAACSSEPLRIPADLQPLIDRLRAGGTPGPGQAVVSYDAVGIRVVGKGSRP